MVILGSATTLGRADSVVARAAVTDSFRQEASELLRVVRLENDGATATEITP
jgi:hypothetical protein